MGWKIYSLGFLQLNDDEYVLIEIKHVFHCILCHSIALGAHVLGLETQGKKGLISCKTENELQPWKNIVKRNINILKTYISEIVWEHSTKTNAFEK